MRISPAWAVAILLTVLPLSGQVERASIVGSITDKSGAVVPDVAITVTNQDTNITARAVTDDSGAFSVVNLIPGTYTVQAVKSGFRNVVYRR